jgi:hypothetical protein
MNRRAGWTNGVLPARVVAAPPEWVGTDLIGAYRRGHVAVPSAAHERHVRNTRNAHSSGPIGQQTPWAGPLRGVL